MLKKGSELKWNGESSISFQKIKQAIEDAPMLRALDYDKPMHIFSFASFHTIAVILLQKNEDGYEKPIAFLKIKQAIKDAPILRALDYDKPMHIFYFSSFQTIVVVFL